MKIIVGLFKLKSQFAFNKNSCLKRLSFSRKSKVVLLRDSIFRGIIIFVVATSVLVHNLN